MISTERVVGEGKSGGRAVGNNPWKLPEDILEISPRAGVPARRCSWPKEFQPGEPFMVRIPMVKEGGKSTGPAPYVQSVSLFFESKDKEEVAELGWVTVNALPEGLAGRNKTAVMGGGVYTAWLKVRESGTIHALVVSNRGAVSRSAVDVKISRERIGV